MSDTTYRQHMFSLIEAWKQSGQLQKSQRFSNAVISLHRQDLLSSS